MKKVLLGLLCALIITPVTAQQRYSEDTPTTDMPQGVLYQPGPGGNNFQNWEYPFGTKLTVNADDSGYRNFELGTKGKMGEGLVFRQWDEKENTWTNWQDLTLSNNGTLTMETRLRVTNNNNPSSAVVLDWFDNIARIRVGGDGTGAGNGLDIQGPGDKSLLRVKESGVGIGTTNLFGYKLAVNGAIGAKEITVEVSSPWPDYVFSEDYALPSLNEVKSFIDKHHHLPEIPSAKEVQEKGVSLGEMNAKLLHKIEELTLYMIELENKNSKLIERVDALESRG